MKKFLFFSILLVIAITTFGQKHSSSKDEYAYGGITLYGSNTWLLNTFVFDKGSDQDIAASFGSGFGLVGGYNFNKNIGAEINLNFAAHNMNYAGTLGNDPKTFTYTAKTRLKYFDIPVLFKAGSETYFEIGPEFSFLLKATYSSTSDSTTTLSVPSSTAKFSSNSSNVDVKNKFAGSSFNLVFGFGHYFEIDKQFSINAGFRLMYGLTDVKGVDALGVGRTDYNSSEKDLSNFKTKLAGEYLHVGIVYKIK